MAREDLLDAVVAHLRRSGLADQSLRDIAAAVGTSHRMLVYHFGSRTGLLAAVVDRVEEEERASARAAAAEAGASLGSAAGTEEVLRRGWRALRRPERADEERLFFELAARALRDAPGTASLRGRLVEPWLDEAEQLARAVGLDVDEARLVTRLDVAVIRGLLLDLLATGDIAGVDAAFERYLRWRAPRAPPAPPST